MSFRFHPEAYAEFLKAIEYYEDVASHLGPDFAFEVYAAIQRAVANPKSWAMIDGDVRRSLVHRFPYGVLYAEENDGIFILAVMHLRRSPDYWKNRI
jgi:plasmid stabilization system protein ParE